ncbi:HEAT repeat protein [Leptospira ryugenii]|uniref:HEAT repeat protein n=1 Tax=Leptospira ryugenii TaxID=1917863 RepID=A0A2P2DVJ9_9LEPT|nr:HEAT repeat domain-containing protein [Leptospira ryugenii]GBF48672.1 HEAT repeat protein [Leptospira ryugenii]
MEETVESEIPNEVLLEDLKSPDIWKRSQAVVALGSRKEKKAIPAFLQFLKSPEPGIRAGSAIALGEMQVKEALPGILKLLESDSENPKDVYLDAIARMARPEAGPKVLPLLNSDDHTLRLQTVDTLVRIQAFRQGPQILELAKQNKDREKDKTYAMALGKLKVTSAESYLIKVASIKDSSPTLAAAYLALGRVRSKKAVPHLVQAIGEEYSKGKENASLALIEIGDTQAISTLFPYLKAKEEETRYYATEVLAFIPSQESGKRALEILFSQDRVAWGSAAKIIGRQKYKEGRETIERLLVDPATPDRDLFAESLGWLGDLKSLPVLIQVLNSKGSEGRYGACWSLGILGDRSALPHLEKAVRDSDAKLVVLAIEAIASIADPSSLQTLKQMLQDRPKLAPQLLLAIGRIPGEEAKAILKDAISSQDEEVYRPAFEEVAKRKDTDFIPSLMVFVNGNQAEKRKLSYYALTAITGKHYRTAKEWNALFPLKP